MAVSRVINDLDNVDIREVETDLSPPVSLVQRSCSSSRDSSVRSGPTIQPDAFFLAGARLSLKHLQAVRVRGEGANVLHKTTRNTYTGSMFE